MVIFINYYHFYRRLSLILTCLLSTNELRQCHNVLGKFKISAGFGTNAIASQFVKISLSVIDGSLCYNMNLTVRANTF